MDFRSPLEIATITYRSGPEWDQRFGRKLRKTSSNNSDVVFAANRDRPPALCPDFLIETYLDYQVGSIDFSQTKLY